MSNGLVEGLQIAPKSTGIGRPEAPKSTPNQSKMGFGATSCNPGRLGALPWGSRGAPGAPRERPGTARGGPRGRLGDVPGAPSGDPGTLRRRLWSVRGRPGDDFGQTSFDDALRTPKSIDFGSILGSKIDRKIDRSQTSNEEDFSSIFDGRAVAVRCLLDDESH